MALHRILDHAVRDRPSHPAVIEGRSGLGVTYGELGALSDRVRDRLVAIGVKPGDRVGVYLHKSVDSVAAIFGILKAGAAYVPVDPTAPAARNAYIHHNCAVKAVVVERAAEAAYRRELDALGARPTLIVLDGVGQGLPLRRALDELTRTAPAPASETVDPETDNVAYILYTSGSTGRPKGVMLSHGNAVSFVDWCSRTFAPQASDIFSSHAPFHFDLSILDLYVPLKHGATLVLIPEDVGKDPQGLAALIDARRITCWYSAPSTLSLLAQFGRIGERDFSALRLVLFAGEVFPVVHLRAFKQQVPRPRYFNLYGPTETNVCTYYEIPEIVPESRTEPYPIGRTCENLLGRVVDADGRDVPAGSEGELCIAGPNVMQGYWALPEQTAKGFLTSHDGLRWYRTGDIVVADSSGDYRYVGRRDRMVKKRGYRIELGEIEACLYQHPAIQEAAAVALPDDAAGVHVRAHLSIRGEKRPSIIELKTFCSARLPVYMVPDSFAFHTALTKTSTDKIDYQALIGLGLQATV